MCWLTAEQLVDLQMLQRFGFPEAGSRKEGKREDKGDGQTENGLELKHASGAS